MPAFQDIQYSPYSPEQLFALVADIEKYPEFLPWCRAARIIRRDEQRMEAELVVCFKSICESYTSEVLLDPAGGRIDVRMLHGPFEYLENHWEFTPEAGGTRIGFKVDFKFRAKLLDMLVGPLFGKASAKLGLAFKQRADQLYSLV